jgi:hypothetical protein
MTIYQFILFIVMTIACLFVLITVNYLVSEQAANYVAYLMLIGAIFIHCSDASHT